MRKFAMLPVLVVLAAGCPRAPDETSARVIELEPFFFTLLKKGNTVEVREYGLEEMFDQGEKLMREGRYSEARAIYLAVAKDSGKVRAAGYAWVNVALCDLAMESPGPALEAVRQAKALLLDPKEQTEVRLLELRALSRLGRWDEVKAAGEELLEANPGGEWGARAHLYMSQAFELKRELDEAERHAQAALDELFSTWSLAQQHGDDMLAEGYFRLGMVHSTLAKRIKFKLPVERMTVDMADKLALMRQAEEHFLSAVRIRSPEWSPRAGYEVGELYRTFGLDLLDAEVPSDLEPLEMQVYSQELSAKVLPLLRRGKEIHEKNISMCDTFRFKSKWRERSVQRAAELGEVIRSLESAARQPPE